jgi:hypothetical protein
VWRHPCGGCRWWRIFNKLVDASDLGWRDLHNDALAGAVDSKATNLNVVLVLDGLDNTVRR